MSILFTPAVVNETPDTRLGIFDLGVRFQTRGVRGVRDGHRTIPDVDVSIQFKYGVGVIHLRRKVRVYGSLWSTPSLFPVFSFIREWLVGTRTLRHELSLLCLYVYRIRDENLPSGGPSSFCTYWSNSVFVSETQVCQDLEQFTDNTRPTTRLVLVRERHGETRSMNRREQGKDILLVVGDTSQRCPWSFRVTRLRHDHGSSKEIVDVGRLSLKSLKSPL